MSGKSFGSPFVPHQAIGTSGTGGKGRAAAAGGGGAAAAAVGGGGGRAAAAGAAAPGGFNGWRMDSLDDPMLPGHEHHDHHHGNSSSSSGQTGVVPMLEDDMDSISTSTAATIVAPNLVDRYLNLGTMGDADDLFEGKSAPGDFISPGGQQFYAETTDRISHRTLMTGNGSLGLADAMRDDDAGLGGDVRFRQVLEKIRGIMPATLWLKMEPHEVMEKGLLACSS